MILDNEQWLLHDCAHTCVYVHVDVQQVFALDKGGMTSFRRIYTLYALSSQ